MQLSKITDQVWQITLPIVNVFLVDLPSGLLLIDAGPKGSKVQLFEAIRQMGKQPDDLRFIILTHAHYDHSGGLAELLDFRSVPVFASALCAEMVKKGVAFRLKSPFARFLSKVVTFNGRFPLTFIQIDPVKTAINVVEEGDVVPNENGLQVIAAPGHTAEQIALFYPVKEAVLFAIDAAENIKSLKPAYAYQSAKVNRQTLNKLSAFAFKTVVFGHGKSVDKQIFDNKFKK